MKTGNGNPKNPKTSFEELMFLIDQSYIKKAWHGPNLRGSVRGLTADQAAWRPGKNRHNIWEIVVHCAYWKYVVRRRILGEKRGSFPLKGSNWFKSAEGHSAAEWRQDLELLETCHNSMRSAITQLGPGNLYRIPSGSKVSNLAIIIGIASHDVYHAGQIQLIKRLHETASS
jgi:uncharacterized damage-inducible protein DinB